MGSIGVRDRVCGLCCVPRRGKGGQEGKPRHQEHRFGKEAAGLADTSCASGGEEWRIGICMSLQAGSRRKGSFGECARKWMRCWRVRKWFSGWAARRGEGQFHRGLRPTLVLDPMLDRRVPPTLREGEHIPRSSTRSRQTPACLTVRAEAWARRCCLKSPKGHGFRCLSMDLGVLDECAWRSR